MADILRPPAGFLELVGCRAKRCDLARFSFFVPSVGELLQFADFRLQFLQKCYTYHARIAVDSPVLRRIYDKKGNGIRKQSEVGRECFQVGAHTYLGNTYGANSPLQLPCTRLFWKRLPATLLLHHAVAANRRSARTKRLPCTPLPGGRRHHRGCTSTCIITYYSELDCIPQYLSQ
jgi:hypothetical protein